MKDTKFSISKIKNIHNDAKIHHTKGAFYEKLGKIDNAIEHYKLAADLDYEKSQYVLVDSLVSHYEKENSDLICMEEIIIG